MQEDADQLSVRQASGRKALCVEWNGPTIIGQNAGEQASWQRCWFIALARDGLNSEEMSCADASP